MSDPVNPTPRPDSPSELREAMSRGHEHDGVNLKGIMIAAVVLVVVTVITQIAMWQIWTAQRETARRAEPATAVLPQASPAGASAPLLQGSERHITWPYEDVEKMKRDNEARLKSSGRNADGSAHIPIEEAMKLTIDRKLLKTATTRPGGGL